MRHHAIGRKYRDLSLTLAKGRIEFLQSLPALSGDRYLLYLGSMCVVMWSFFWIFAPAWGAGVILGLTYQIALIFIIVSLIKAPHKFPRSFLFNILLIIQIWSFCCALSAERFLGRPILFGRAESYILMALIPFFVVWRCCDLHPPFRRFVVNSLLLVLGASAVVAWMQFMRLPPAMALARTYTYKPIDNWDGHPGIRAVGLSVHPNQLVFQATMGLALVCSSVILRPLNRTQGILAALFAGAAVFTQSRGGLVPFTVVVLVIMIFVVKQDPKQAARFIVGGTACLGMMVVIGAKRFEYLMMTTSGNDYSQMARVGIQDSVLGQIIPNLPLTGIGPSAGLMLGAGSEGRWVPNGRIVESGYLLFQAMYGVPGVCLMILAWAGSSVAATLAILKAHDEMQKRLLFVGGLCATFIGLNAYSFNTFDTYLHLPMATLIGGMAAVAPGNARFRNTDGTYLRKWQVAFASRHKPKAPQDMS